MKEVKLNNGVIMPQPGFGTFLTPDGETAVNAVRCAIEQGYRHIDTAAVYGNEVSVGEGIRQSGVPREELFITSKVWNTERGYETTLRAFDKTIKDLGVDYLDLYLIHWPANKKQFGDAADGINQDTWRALEKLHNEGLIRSIGLSNFMPHHLDAILAKAESVRPWSCDLRRVAHGLGREVWQYGGTTRYPLGDAEGYRASGEVGNPQSYRREFPGI